MKKLIILLFALVTINNAMAQWPSDCDVTEVIGYYYEEDVKDIAAQWLFDIHSPDTALIDIPQWCQDTVWAGLAAISNRYDLPAVDSVINKYCIHRVQGFVNIKRIAVSLDPTCSWLENWINGDIITGVETIDTLLSHYNFTLNYMLLGITGVLETTEMINLYALCDSLESFEGINIAYPDGWTGNAAYYDHIYFSDTAGVRYYLFQAGVGLSGCYLWNFKVNSDCSIEFQGNGGTGNGLPNPANCNILTSVDEHINSKNYFASPNPANDKITISAPVLTGIGQLSIFNVNGEKVLEMQITHNKTLINISGLPQGMYFLRLQHEKNVGVVKMIKQ